jgi:hypothetical protein
MLPSVNTKLQLQMTLPPEWFLTHITSKWTIPSISVQMKIQVTLLVKIFPTNITWIWKNPNVTVLFLQTTQIHEWFLKNNNHTYNTHADISADVCGSLTFSDLHYTNKNIQLEAHVHWLLSDFKHMTNLLYRHFCILRKRNSPEKGTSNCSQRRKEEFHVKQCSIRMKRRLGYMVHTIHCRSVCLCMHAQRKVIKRHVIYYVYHTTHVMLNGSLPPHNGAPKHCRQRKQPPAAKGNTE